MQYVVAHEVAHLKEKNHQKDFWNLVKFLFPKYKKVRNELKNLIIL
ncbi:M48 family metallopeptidase [bacterium]|nr:M48 family metallopeptidase [bacterium]